MAHFFRGQGSQVAGLQIWLLALSLVILSSLCAKAQTLYERPVLIVDPGMHTAASRTAAVDDTGRFLATGSNDKTVRIWSASDGTLLRTIRMPAGPGSIGAISAVAMSPHGDIVAAGTWGESRDVTAIYLFDRNTGKMTRRIEDLPSNVTELVFSVDGRYLAAVCGSGGLRVFDRGRDWSEVFRDLTYGDESYGAAFADDGRLATSSLDGKVRLYDRNFRLIAIQEALSGRDPAQIRFRPDGKVLAIGYVDKPSVDLLDGFSLARLPGPNVDGLDGGSTPTVAWSADGQMLFASGVYTDTTGNNPVLTWDQAGRGTRRAISAKCAENDDSTMTLLSLPAGWLLVVKFNPCFTMLKGDGTVLWTHRAPGGDFRDPRGNFSVSADGAVIDFGFEQFGKSPLRFDLRALKLSNQWPADDRTRPPSQGGLRIEDWDGSTHPKLGGKPIELGPHERSLSLAIHPDAHRFVLGADFSLRAFDAQGKPQWRRLALGPVWAVNITGDGRLVVAAEGGTGTIRWHRMDDGRELLALQVLNDKKNWVAWTPDGFYDATPGAFGVLKWHKNRGSDAAADATPVYKIQRLKRPDVLPLVLQELEIVRALGIAELAAVRADVQAATGAAVGPGARLHILAIGISDYGDKATSLRLKFAAKDANDVASALHATQGSEFNKTGGLYAEVRLQYLHDGEADRAAIFRALGSMKANMAKEDTGQDLAVVLFSGHGAILDDRFYLLPYGVDARTPAELKASAILASEFHDEVAQLAKYGRVLVLLDACHSGAITGDGSTLTSDADRLRSIILASNVTVLTSSTANEFSREEDKWNNGAFTKVLLDALGKDADENHDGVISMSELTSYVWTHVISLTDGPTSGYGTAV
jgi:WD40 repeat protein